MRLLAMFLLAGLWSCEQRIPGGAMMDAMVTVDGRCLGVLVSSELVLYPGHCGSKTEYIGTVVGKLSTEACWVHQEGMLGNGTDFAACRLSASVSVPAAHVGAFEPGDQVFLVDAASDGSRQYIDATMLEDHGKELLVRLPAGVFCRGSSGAPLFAKRGGRALVIGLGSSRAKDTSCDSPGSAWFVRASEHLAWARQTEPNK